MDEKKTKFVEMEPKDIVLLGLLVLLGWLLSYIDINEHYRSFEHFSIHSVSVVITAPLSRWNIVNGSKTMIVIHT